MSLEVEAELMRMALCEAGRPELAERIRVSGAGDDLSYIIETSDGRFPERRLTNDDRAMLNKAVKVIMPDWTEENLWLPEDGTEEVVFDDG